MVVFRCFVLWGQKHLSCYSPSLAPPPSTCPHPRVSNSSSLASFSVCVFFGGFLCFSSRVTLLHDNQKLDPQTQTSPTPGSSLDPAGPGQVKKWLLRFRNSTVQRFSYLWRLQTVIPISVQRGPVQHHNPETLWLVGPRQHHWTERDPFVFKLESLSKISKRQHNTGTTTLTRSPPEWV